MKYHFVRFGFGLITVTVVLVMLTTGFLNMPAKEPVKSSLKGFVVIELFTSEGCSSCPAADAEVEKIAGMHSGDVYVLGFHVDYWNRLGWKDEFSNAAYSERQREYAAHFNLENVYTPQVVVNGKVQLVGSDGVALSRLVNTEIKNPANQSIEIMASMPGSKTVQVTYKNNVTESTMVNIALVQKKVQTKVKRGENEGRILRQINIVRDFKTIHNGRREGTANLVLPNGLAANECEVIVYLQQVKTRGITAVAATTIR